jgi:hypothetical protein
VVQIAQALVADRSEHQHQDQDNAKTQSQAKTELHVFDEIHDFFS